jgi:Spx/MgsR family transcriptional regulator
MQPRTSGLRFFAQRGSLSPFARKQAMANPTIYGISNCDTVRKARRWLEQNEHAFAFHDFRRDGLDRALLQRWLDQLPIEQLVNRRGTSWRQLSEAQRDALLAGELSLILEQPTLIKRPVLELGEQILIGFKEDEYRQFLGKL